MNVTVKPLSPCHRCGGELYLAVTTPHPTMYGDRLMVLCPRCDAHDPIAQDLLAWFAINSTVGADSLAEVEALVAQWVEWKQQTPTGADAADAYYRGDYE